MVKVPTQTFIDSISNRKVYYFSSNQISSKVPHYFICIRRTEDDLLFMSCCTSQFDTVRKFVESRSLPFETLVHISPKDENNPFDKDTYINCNDLQTYTVEEFREMYDSNDVDFSGVISENHYEQILTGIHLSPVIEDDIKELIPKQVS